MRIADREERIVVTKEPIAKLRGRGIFPPPGEKKGSLTFGVGKGSDSLGARGDRRGPGELER